MLGSQKSKDKNSNLPQGLVNLIGVGTEIKGDVSCDGDIRIDGRVDGNIRAGQRLVIGSGGTVVGNIDATHVVIAGSVTGNIRAQQSSLLQGSSSIKGDISTAQIIIESGAFFNGRCVMETQSHND